MEDELTSKQITGDRTAAGLTSHDTNAGAVRQSISDRQKGMRSRGESDLDSGSTAGATLNGDAGAATQGGHAPADRAGSQPTTGQPAGTGTSGSGSAEGVSTEDGRPAIGPSGAAPQWRDFYRAIRNAVTDMRSEK